MVSTPVIIFLVAAAVFVVVLLVWFFVWPLINTDQTRVCRPSRSGGNSRDHVPAAHPVKKGDPHDRLQPAPGSETRVSRSSAEPIAPDPRSDDAVDHHDGRQSAPSGSKSRFNDSLHFLQRVRNVESLVVDQPSGFPVKLGQDAGIAFEQLRNGFPQNLFTLETDGILFNGKQVYVDTQIKNTDRRSNNKWWIKSLPQQVRLLQEDTGKVFELDESTRHQVSNFKHFQLYNEYPLMAIIGNPESRVGVFFHVRDNRVYYNQSKNQGTLELIHETRLRPQISGDFEHLRRVRNATSLKISVQGHLTPLKRGHFNAFIALQNGKDQSVFELVDNTVTCGGFRVFVKLDEDIQNEIKQEKWWMKADEATLRLCKNRRQGCNELSQDEKQHFAFFKTYNEYPFESLRLTREGFAPRFSVQDETIFYTSGKQGESTLKLIQTESGNIESLFEIRNHTCLAIKTTDGNTPLSPAEQSAFEQLRIGNDDHVFELKNNTIFSKDRGEVVIRDIKNNKDARPDGWWWKSIEPQNVRFLDREHNHLFTLDKRRAQISNFKVFQQYNEFPFRALEEFSEFAPIGKKFYQIRSDNRLVYILSTSGVEWDVVSTKDESYIPANSMYKLLSIYESGYGFQTWSIEAVAKEYHKYMAPTRVFYRANADINTVKLLTNQREPVNIAMERHYDQGRLEKWFGYRTGAYERVQQPAPNIAIYTFTKVLVNEGNQQYHDVHILHVIGLAFDDEDQVDYKHYMALTKIERRKQVVAFYTSMFHTVFQACLYLNLTQLVMSMVGANNFAILYRDDGVTTGDGGQFQEQIWRPTWETVASGYKQVKVSFMGVPGKDACMFPACVLVKPDALFVNAWDCWSIVGNGNEKDPSLDGIVGRFSTAALTSWPRTNMYMHDGCYIPLK